MTKVQKIINQLRCDWIPNYIALYHCQSNNEPFVDFNIIFIEEKFRSLENGKYNNNTSTIKN